MQKEAIIKTPGWVAEQDVISLIRHDLQLKLAYYKSQCRIFEHKYKQSFHEFEAATRAARKEEYQEWEDFMDWETADSARLEMEHRLQELTAWKT